MRITSLFTIFTAFAIIATFLFVHNAEAKKKTQDPKHCEVCKKVVGDIITKVKALPKKQRKNKEEIEAIIGKHCADKGKKLGVKEKKICYYMDIFNLISILLIIDRS